MNGMPWCLYSEFVLSYRGPFEWYGIVFILRFCSILQIHVNGRAWCLDKESVLSGRGSCKLNCLVLR